MKTKAKEKLLAETKAWAIQFAKDNPNEGVACISGIRQRLQHLGCDLKQALSYYHAWCSR